MICFSYSKVLCKLCINLFPLQQLPKLLLELKLFIIQYIKQYNKNSSLFANAIQQQSNISKCNNNIYSFIFRQNDSLLIFQVALETLNLPLPIEKLHIAICIYILYYVWFNELQTLTASKLKMSRVLQGGKMYALFECINTNLMEQALILLKKEYKNYIYCSSKSFANTRNDMK